MKVKIILSTHIARKKAHNLNYLNNARKNGSAIFVSGDSRSDTAEYLEWKQAKHRFNLVILGYGNNKQPFHISEKIENNSIKFIKDLKDLVPLLEDNKSIFLLVKSHQKVSTFNQLKKLLQE